MRESIVKHIQRDSDGALVRGEGWTRRRFLTTAASAVASTALPRLSARADVSWRAGALEHLIPAASHDRFAIKCSFAESLAGVPRLRIGKREVAGRATDSEGLFFSFDVDGLEPDVEYALQLFDTTGSELCDAWPLRTHPSPDSRPEFVRLLAYTCAGGHPEHGGDTPWFLPLAARRRLLARALSFKPHATIAIGDHIYWDQRSALEHPNQEYALSEKAFFERVGWLDRNWPALGTPNERSLKAAVGPQISQLYGVLLRSTPSYFVSDDHDYYENDEADERMVTLPPERYQLEFARFTRNAYLPEFLPDRNRPLSMSGTGAADRATGISEAFGTFRYGRLAEALIYDCARFLSLKGERAGLVPPEVERWLHARNRASSVAQLLHVPSHPFGWSAGKWREWYPDVADIDEGSGRVASQTYMKPGRHHGLTTNREKYLWQIGWWKQHQRLLESLSSQPGRAPIVLSGDLHAIGHAALLRSSDLDLSANPVHALLTGPVGTSGSGWPSVVRGTPPLAATGIVQRSHADVLEKNGFTLLDITPDEVTVRLFAWTSSEPLDTIDTLEPYHTKTIRRA